MKHAHQHAQLAGDNPNVVLESSLYTRVDGHAGHVVQNRGSTSAAAPAQSSFRDYEEPKRRSRDNPDVTLCEVDGCKAFRSKKHAPWCAGHARQKGLITYAHAE